MTFVWSCSSDLNFPNISGTLHCNRGSILGCTVAAVVCTIATFSFSLFLLDTIDLSAVDAIFSPSCCCCCRFCTCSCSVHTIANRTKLKRSSETDPSISDWLTDWMDSWGSSLELPNGNEVFPIIFANMLSFLSLNLASLCSKSAVCRMPLQKVFSWSKLLLPGLFVCFLIFSNDAINV